MGADTYGTTIACNAVPKLSTIGAIEHHHELKEKASLVTRIQNPLKNSHCNSHVVGGSTIRYHSTMF